jgi:DNA-3-methyladenine glycosylase
VAGRPTVSSAARPAAWQPGGDLTPRGSRTREPGTAPQSAPAPLPASFYDRPVVEVAHDLIGCVLSVGACSGMVVETEAYHHSEPACHAYVGLTARTSMLFAPPGRAYVYRSYGIHALLNAVCEGPEVGAAVLVRALEPIRGRDEMILRRGPRAAGPRQLCSGPGKLTQALGIDLADNGADLTVGPIRFSRRDPECSEPAITATTRIGITKGVELPWRFCLTGSRFLSVPVRA